MKPKEQKKSTPLNRQTLLADLDATNYKSERVRLQSRSSHKSSRIPKTYLPAIWRNTTPSEKDSQSIGIGFDLESGKTIRLKLDRKSAFDLWQTIAGYLTIGQGIGCISTTKKALAKYVKNITVPSSFRVNSFKNKSLCLLEYKPNGSITMTGLKKSDGSINLTRIRWLFAIAGLLTLIDSKHNK